MNSTQNQIDTKIGDDDTQEGEDAIDMEKLSTAMLYPAVALLAIGIFIGAVWANVSWGNY